MATNPTLTAARRPRGIVQLNGTAIDGWVQFEVDTKSYFSADTFRVVFVASALPAAMNAQWMAAQTDMFVELFAGFPDDVNSYSAAELTSLIYGQVDDISYDPVAGTIELNGRDMTRVFLETKNTTKWVNQTSSDVAAAMALAHGLNYVVTITDTQVGKFYEIDHTNMSDSRTEWDVLCYLANIEGFYVYVRGKILYFAPRSDDTSDPYQLIWTPGTNGGAPSANVENLSCTRALTVSRGIQVVIRSWNSKQQKGFTAQYPATASSDAQVHSRTVPNLTQAQATKMAETMYAQLMQHEMKISASLPADVTLDTSSVLQLTGTGTAFDQFYYPDSITREMSFSDGFTMHVSAKNQAPQVEDNTG